MLQLLFISAFDHIQLRLISRHICYLTVYHGICGKVNRLRRNQIQHTKLHHFSDVTLSKLQHILKMLNFARDYQVHTLWQKIWDWGLPDWAHINLSQRLHSF